MSMNYQISKKASVFIKYNEYIVRRKFNIMRKTKRKYFSVQLNHPFKLRLDSKKKNGDLTNVCFS